MVTITGSLLVKKSEYDSDDQVTSWLQCDLGHFRAIHSVYTLKEGVYKGFFTLSKIQQSCYRDKQGKYSFELEAVIEKMAFLPDENAAFDSIIPTNLSVDETDQTVKTECKAEKSIIQNHFEFEHDSDDEELFGQLYPLEIKVKLDPSVDRKKLNLQINRLSKLGYKFLKNEQAWCLSSVLNEE